jgi:hypothetical protein
VEITRISAFKNETKNAQNATAEFPVRAHMTDCGGPISAVNRTTDREIKK